MYICRIVYVYLSNNCIYVINIHMYGERDRERKERREQEKAESRER